MNHHIAHEMGLRNAMLNDTKPADLLDVLRPARPLEMYRGAPVASVFALAYVLHSVEVSR